MYSLAVVPCPCQFIFVFKTFFFWVKVLALVEFCYLASLAWFISITLSFCYRFLENIDTSCCWIVTYLSSRRTLHWSFEKFCYLGQLASLILPTVLLPSQSTFLALVNQLVLTCFPTPKPGPFSHAFDWSYQREECRVETTTPMVGDIQYIPQKSNKKGK